MRTEARRVLVLATLLALVGGAAAHATLVFGTVTTDPTPAPAGAPFTIRLELRDPADAPVEDAVVHVEADPQEEDDAAAPPADDAAAPLVTSEEFDEVAPGTYETTLTLPEDGAWALTFRDRTFRQEEARATVTIRVGPDAGGERLSFIFPPTATGPRSLTTWLVWLVGLPLVAGAVVTVMVLRGGREDQGGGERPDPPGTDPAPGGPDDRG